ncbi:MAG: hypothetical protein ACRDFB_06365 [Rhabdochlamydiaceae bacterium]
MPTGTGAINQKNLPATPYEVNPTMFNALTQKQLFDPQNFTFASPANYVTQVLRQVGIIAKIRLLIQGSIVTTGTGTFAYTYKWPYGICKNVQLSGNQMNNFISATGNDLYLREVVQNRAYVDEVTSYTAASGITGAGTYPFTIVLTIPVAMDMTSLTGALYAQTEATNLTLTLTAEALANLFSWTGTAATLTNTAGTAGTTPNVLIEETIFSIPYNPQKQGVLVIPDLTVLHGFISNDVPVASQSTVTTNLYRTNADLYRLFYLTDNNNVLVSTADTTNAQLMYGASEVPYAFNPALFNKVWNNETVRLNLGNDGEFVLDFSAENPSRDKVILEGVTNLRLQTQYSGVTWNAAAYVHTVQETLFA